MTSAPHAHTPRPPHAHHLHVQEERHAAHPRASSPAHPLLRPFCLCHDLRCPPYNPQPPLPHCLAQPCPLPYCIHLSTARVLAAAKGLGPRAQCVAGAACVVLRPQERRDIARRT
jgi:hypothetical protein